MTILIPAYEPDERLIALTEEILNKGNISILVIDDGSGEKYSSVFALVRAQGIEVLTHKVNKGKGAALKTGFEHILSSDRYTCPVVTADCDGQHKVNDILAVADASEKNPSRLVLGCRKFIAESESDTKVPLRNKLGNLFSVTLFRLATGMHVSDTQTGLRGFSRDMLPWLLSISGDRFEYEQKMLLETKKAGFPPLELPIETVYDKENYSTHYRPVRDSLRVIAPILKYFSSSLTSFIIDYTLVLVLEMHFSLFTSVVMARIVSAAANFILNKLFVFNDTRSKRTGKALLKYSALAIALVLASYGLITLMRDLAGIPLPIAKLIADILLFCVSYWVQRRYIFY